MSRAFVALLGLLASCATGQSDGCRLDRGAPPGEPVLLGVRGTVRRIGSAGFGIATDAPPATLYVPSNLPSACAVDALRIRFSARVDPIDPAVRRTGIPIELYRVQVEKD